MCAALAQAPAQAPSGYPVDAFVRSICATTLFGINAKGLNDGDRPSVFRVRATILPIAASKLAQRSVDAKTFVVRKGGNSRAAESCTKVDLRTGYQSRVEQPRQIGPNVRRCRSPLAAFNVGGSSASPAVDVEI